MISEFEARLAVVPRWCVVHTVQKQSVAEHSFYVALIAPRIALEWYDAAKMDWRWMHELTRYALLHDQLEAYSGDIAGMVKDLFDDDELHKRYNNELTEYPNNDNLIRSVVKCADLYERCFFMATELAMGNHSIGGIYTDNLKLLSDHMIDTGAGTYWNQATIELNKRCNFRTRTMDLRPK